MPHSNHESTHSARSAFCGAGSSRRGSVLVLVVGVLALLAIIALVYATIGQGDRRGAAAMVAKSQTDDNARQIGDYLAQVIGDSVVNTAFRTTTSPDNITTVSAYHPLRDYPGVDPLMLSGTGQAWRKFTPTGSMLAPWNGSNVDPRIAVTPWLASTEPLRLNPQNQPPLDPSRTYADEGDWASLSVFSPDGRFVNLANLRGNFNVASGVGPNTISDNLYLLRVTGATTFQTDTRLENGLGQNADPNVPAHWATRQFGVFRPVGDRTRAPGDPRNLDNMYGDADGDGLYDSRWAEFVNAFGYDAGPDGIIGTGDDQILPAYSVIANSGQMRLFFIARAIDLSGLVNVNTATSLREPGIFNANSTPREYFPIGLFPSDVDIERLLAMRDVYHVHGYGYGVNGTAQPGVAARASNYSDYEGAYDEVGQSAYAGILTAQLTGTVPNGALAPGAVPGGFTALFPGDRLTALSRALLFQTAGRDPAGATYFPSGGTVAFAYGSAFSVNDLGELLTYWTINNPGLTSRLEAATGGRYGQYPNLDPLRSNRPLELEREGNNTALDWARFRRATDVRHLVTTVSGARPLMATSLPPNASGSSLLAASVKFDVQSALTTLVRPGATPSQTDLNYLFKFFADALLPYSAEGGAWDRSNARARVLHYGGARQGFTGNAAEVALRAAAHLTVNLIAMRSPGDEPVLMSVLIDREYGESGEMDGTNADGGLKYPGWVDPISGRNRPYRPRLVGKLDLEATNNAVQRLAGSPHNQVPSSISTPAMNIYSVAPQPFVTQVAVFTMYSDVHEAYGGDGRVAQAPTPPEWRLVPGANPGDPDVLESNPITMNGAMRKSNKDFMLEMVAFQVTNPFDAEIALTALDATGGNVPNATAVGATDYRFYFEFGGRYYKIAETDFLTGENPQSVVLKAGETRVFYVLGENPAEIAARMRVADPAFPGGSAGTDVIREWIDSKLSFPDQGGVPQRPIRIVSFDPTTGESVAVAAGDQPGVINPQGAGVAAAPETNRVVLLWKAMNTSATGAGLTFPRSVLNDMLVDRLRDPDSSGRPTLDKRLPARNTQVIGTSAGPDPQDPLSATYPSLDNTGFSITFHGSIRRPDNPGGSVPLGALPAYAIEAKSSVTGHFASHNKTEDLNNIDTRSPKRQDFVGSRAPHASISFSDTRRGLWRMQRNAALLQSITQRPDARSSSTIGSSGLNGSGPAFTDLYVEMGAARPAGTTADPFPPLRLADLLLPLAVGPYSVPEAAALDDRWTTLGEALALALDYDSPSASDDPTYAIGRADAAPGQPIGAFDRGHLRLDAFVPFDDSNNNGTYEPQQGDSLRGEGVPMAFNILSRARVQKFGSITSMASGLININTAPMNVLRALPLLTPDAFTWAGRGANPLFNSTTERFDVAATITAYRDKIAVLSRPTTANQTDFVSIDFRDANDGSPFLPDPDPIIARQQANGRAIASGMPFIREDPGFMGTGEVLAARIIGGAVGLNDVDARDNSIDRFGRDTVVFNPQDEGGNDIGAVSQMYGSPPQPTTIRDSYSQKLIIANAILNSISTRSDVFAVWFVVRGYLPSDVEGLTIDDPMVPTLNRRYVMVVDRSNVTAAGQKPKILLFQEVPAN